ncbi:unnamed protein product [Linum tenue]|uniref:Phosphoglycerate mutase-like protein n=1 Tax=Linum tenue TaxID=586396 RepID=A0AAV0NZM1_9ROSI|nr:unnamed protein product [Linum tenue]
MEDAGCPTTTLYPLHRTKILHLVRHAQGIHNVEGEKDPSAYFSPDLSDAHLTQLGWRQVAHLRTHIRQSGLHSRIQLVVTSSLLRAMQTAVGVFGGEEYVDGVEKGNSASPAISSFDSPPFLATELCREHLVCCSCLLFLRF